MKSSNLPLQDQFRFFNAIENISRSERIHKKDLSIVIKTLNCLDKIKNTQETFIFFSDNSSLKFNICNPSEVKAFFTRAALKLGAQGSKMFDEKYEKLMEISEYFLEKCKNINVQSAGGIQSDIAKLESDLSKSEEKSDYLAKKVEENTNSFKWICEEYKKFTNRDIKNMSFYCDDKEAIKNKYNNIESLERLERLESLESDVMRNVNKYILNNPDIDLQHDVYRTLCLLNNEKADRIEGLENIITMIISKGKSPLATRYEIKAALLKIKSTIYEILQGSEQENINKIRCELYNLIGKHNLMKPNTPWLRSCL
ncbi:hypothetical protein VL10_20680 [Leclercia adecarboxylata]|nr:hypothetical protein VL10_20680 [Leclercia adecarboxylata]